MQKEFTEKQKELLNIYWFVLGFLAIFSLVNLLAISEDGIKTAAIIDFILMIIIPIVFVMGYIDFRNYKPLGKINEILFCLVAIIGIWISLIHFNVQNYTFLSDVTGENYYNVALSALVALYFAIGLICLILTILNPHNRKKQRLIFYVVTATSLVSSIFLTGFNYSTKVSLFWAPLRLMGIKTPIVADTGMTILALRVFVEYCLFLNGARMEKKNGTIRQGEQNEYMKSIVILSIIVIVFILIIVIALPAISIAEALDDQNFRSYFLTYEVLELLSIIALLSVGGTIAFIGRKNKKYSAIYLRMGIASIIFALVYLIMDFIPITAIIKSTNEVKNQITSDVFQAITKMLGLLAYTLYVAFNKKLNAQLKVLDEESEEKLSSEHYAI